MKEKITEVKMQGIVHSVSMHRNKIVHIIGPLKKEKIHNLEAIEFEANYQAFTVGQIVTITISSSVDLDTT